MDEMKCRPTWFKANRTKVKVKFKENKKIYKEKYGNGI